MERESIITPTARHVFDVQRFTRHDYERGTTAGWDLYGSWCQRASGLMWAWFRGEVPKDTMIPAELAAKLVLRVVAGKLRSTIAPEQLDVCVSHEDAASDRKEFGLLDSARSR